jgi:dGTPase
MFTTKLDPVYEKKIRALEDHFRPHAKRSTDSLGRKNPISEDPFRTPFERDFHRVLHSLPFRRLKHKTQVFFSPKDDHICTRMEHSLHVSSISSTVCKRLDLNATLAEAIAIAHDLGHPPFGHPGENAIREIQTEYIEKHQANKLPPFYHEAQSLRVIDCFQNKLHEPLNLTCEVRDGVVCHCGELNESSLKPQYDKDLDSVDITAARNQRPATIEGCVARIADTISYLGRDFEDACMAELISQKDLPPDLHSTLAPDDTKNINSQIIGTLINDLVDNSKKHNYLKFSDNVFSALETMKDFNTQKIYWHVKLIGQERRIHLILNELFGYFSDILEDNIKFSKIMDEPQTDHPCGVFADFLNDMKYPSYTTYTDKAQIVTDFIVGMTDNFALTCFQDLFHVKSII